MSTEQFITHTFSTKTVALIEHANVILREYAAQGYQLTLRQLYYQFVARDLLPNSQRSYKALGEAISNARLAGLIDWSAIEDRGRSLRSWPTFDDVQSFLEATRSRFMLDLWEGQDTYVEVWVEKEALIGVIERACGEHRIPHFACKGYNSQTAQYDAGKRFERHLQQGRHVVLLHLGDHDPSGLDMTRDNRERLTMFAWTTVEVRRLALNMDQVDQYSPPPNPAKLSDSRADEYVDRYGTESWELDALEPRVISELVRTEIDTLIDRDKMDAVRERENDCDAQLAALTHRWADVVAFLDEGKGL